jgi:GMP synthase-like glutamine amidotransferase
MKLAIIDNNETPMTTDQARGRGFVDALAGRRFGEDYEFVRHESIPDRLPELRRCRGLILSGSQYDFADGNDRFALETYIRMAPEFRLIREIEAPVLGICFGHQLMAIAEDFREDRSDFGGLRIRNMGQPADNYLVVPMAMRSSFRFINARPLWVQHNHKQEVTLNESLQSYFDVIAGSDQCGVEMMQHRQRDWFGVQFHPEVGRESRRGEGTRHDDAVRDGQSLIGSFVRYCLG